jgi:hypothetical protein
MNRTGMGAGGAPTRASRIAVWCVLLAFAGCQGTGMTVPGLPTSMGGGATTDVSPAATQMRADADAYNQVVLGGALMGAGIGAATAAATCLFVTSRNRSQCAMQRGLAGGVAGGIAGAVDGYVTAKKQQATRDRVRAIDSVTADIRAENQRIASFVASSDRVLAESRATLARLKQDVAAKRLAVDEARSKHASVEADRDVMQQTLDNAKKSREVYRQSSAQLSPTPRARRDLDAEIGKLTKEIATLERNVTSMNAALSVSRV